jgi:hypothetical protein
MSSTESFLLAQRDNLFPQPLLLAGRSACTRDLREELTLGLLAELMNQNAEATRRVAEPSGHLGRWGAIYEEGPQGFVLALGGAGGIQEAVRQC